MLNFAYFFRMYHNIVLVISGVPCSICCVMSLITFLSSLACFLSNLIDLPHLLRSSIPQHRQPSTFIEVCAHPMEVWSDQEDCQRYLNFFYIPLCRLSRGLRTVGHCHVYSASCYLQQPGRTNSNSAFALL